MPIVLDIDNTDPDHKIFIGSAAGAQAKAAEDQMAATIKRYVERSGKAQDFTVVKSADAPKGYVLLLKLAKVEADVKNAKCIITGQMVQYPRERNAKGEIGDIAVALALRSSGGVQNTRNPIVECVDALVEDIMKTAVPEMRRHFATRR